MDENYYSLNVKEVLKSLKTSEKGLTKKEAEQSPDREPSTVNLSSYHV
ncbi:MAG: hypothetical protein K8R28_10740 [Desulfobacterales bacterium]|nr:hypothetical protein [Desulfobacterales bacterium]